MGLLPYGVSNSNPGACDTCSGHLSCLRLSFPSSRTWSYYLRTCGTFLSIFSSVVSSWFKQVLTLVWAVTTLHPDGTHSLFCTWGRWKAGSLNLQVTHWFLSGGEVGVFSWCCRGVSGRVTRVVGKCPNCPCLLDVSSLFVLAWRCCVVLTGFWSILNVNLVHFCLHGVAESWWFLFLHLVAVLRWVLMWYVCEYSKWDVLFSIFELCLSITPYACWPRRFFA